MIKRILKELLFFTVVFFSVNEVLFAQEINRYNTDIHNFNRDTVELNIGKNHNGYLNKKFRQLFFRRNANNAFIEDREENYLEYEDKKIRYIYIKVLKPFGPKIQDSSIMVNRWIEKLGNKIHINTKENYVRKLISFSNGDFVSAWELADNERFLRKQSIFNDVSIEIIPVDNSYVDIVVICEDVFSFAAEISSDFKNKFDLSVFNKNMFGIGHQLVSDILYNKDNSTKWSYALNYSIKNISRTYIDFNIGIKKNVEGNGFNLSLSRGFALASTKWAGLLSLVGIRNAYRLNQGEKINSNKLFNYLYFDSWLGFSHNFYNNYKQVNNLMLAASYMNTVVSGNPLDSKLFPYFMDRRIVLFSGTLSERKYYKSNYIFDLGRTEDVVEGYRINLTVGTESNEQYDLYYSGIELSKSWFYKRNMEYLISAFNIGSFYNKKRFERGVIGFKIQSFSKLLKMYKSNVRYRTELSYIIGFRRYPDDFITLDDGIRGFRSKELIGNQKLSLKLTQNIFMPYIVNGFRSSLFTFADFGWIGSNKQFILSTSDYYGFGFGLKLNNDNMIFRTFSIRFAYYPRVPNDLNKFSTIVSSSSGADFIKLKPSRPNIIPYK